MYPSYIDDNVARPISGIVFTLTLLTVLNPNVSMLIGLLFLDFILRFIHPKYSPFSIVIKMINTKILKIAAKPYFSAPKRFGILIGIVLTGIISISIYFEIVVLQIILSIILLTASNLQSFFGFCVGCEVYDRLLRWGVIRQPSQFTPTQYIKNFGL